MLINNYKNHSSAHAVNSWAFKNLLVHSNALFQFDVLTDQILLFLSLQVEHQRISIDHAMDEEETVRLNPPLTISLSPATGKLTHYMNKLGQLNTGPHVVSTSLPHTQCHNFTNDLNSSCYCCSNCNNMTGLCQNTTVQCLRESNAWYNLYAPGKTVANQNLSGKF